MMTFYEISKEFEKPKRQETHEFAKELRTEIAEIEARRLKQPTDGSFYKNLCRFSKRAIAIGSIMTSVYGETEAVQPTQTHELTASETKELKLSEDELYKPFFEDWLIETADGEIFNFKDYNKEKSANQELLKKGGELELIIEKIIQKIGKSEKLPLLKTAVVFKITEKIGFPVDAVLYQSINTLGITLRDNFDIEKDEKVLEAVLAHELGHIADYLIGNLGKETEGALLQARAAFPEVDTKLKELESKITEKETVFNPELTRDKKKLEELKKKLAIEKLNHEEAKNIRNEIFKLLDKIDSATEQITAEDPDYRAMIEETLKLESKIRPAFFKYATQNGGREIRADFFMAKWAVRQGWSRDEFEEIIIKSLGKSGHYSELSFYPGSREARRYLILWYYDKISQDKDMWLNLPNDTNTIKNYIEKLYTD